MAGLLIVLLVGFDEPVREAPLRQAAQPTQEAPAAPSSTEPPGQPQTTAAPARAVPQIAPEPHNADRDAPSATPAADLPAWRRFAAVHGPVLDRPMIAVIIDDMGLDAKRSALAIELPGPLTMSYLTYARSVKRQAAAARAGGHEVMIHVPMEPDDSNTYAGPKAIRSDLPASEIKRRLGWALGRLQDYVGINNHMGSRFTAHAPGMALVLAELKHRGLLFVDSRTTPKSVAPEVSRQFAVPFAVRDLFLDDDPAREAIAEKLTELEKIATAQGYAIAIGHPYDSTLGLLAKWIPTLASRGYVLVPVSAVVRRRQEGG